MSHKEDPVLEIPSNYREEEELAQLNQSEDVEKLRSLLGPDEKVYRLIIGFHEDSDGVLAATNRRIIYADQRFITSKVLHYNYAEIAAVVYATHLTTQEITLVHKTGSFTIVKVDKKHGDRFIELVGSVVGEDYQQKKDLPRVFEQRGDMLELEDLPSQQEDA